MELMKPYPHTLTNQLYECLCKHDLAQMRNELVSKVYLFLHPDIVRSALGPNLKSAEEKSTERGQSDLLGRVVDSDAVDFIRVRDLYFIDNVVCWSHRRLLKSKHFECSISHAHQNSAILLLDH